MIICKPWYTVSYKGVFYKAGEAFKADGADREELSRHCGIEDADEPVEEAALEEPVPVEEAPVKKPGRPRKQEAHDG